MMADACGKDEATGGLDLMNGLDDCEPEVVCEELIGADSTDGDDSENEEEDGVSAQGTE